MSYAYIVTTITHRHEGTFLVIQEVNDSLRSSIATKMAAFLKHKKEVSASIYSFTYWTSVSAVVSLSDAVQLGWAEYDDAPFADTGGLDINLEDITDDQSVSVELCELVITENGFYWSMRLKGDHMPMDSFCIPWTHLFPEELSPESTDKENTP